MSLAAPDAGRTDAVNGLRALAIFGVIFHHYTWDHFGPLNPASPIAGLWTPIRLALESGWLGVNLFFFLSGFVLYLPYALERRRMDGGADALAFLLRRARRLLPLYYFAGILALAFGLTRPFDIAASGAGPGAMKELATFLTATFIFFPDTYMPSYNWVLWSLGVEIWFSLLFPLLLPAYRARPALTLAAAVLVALGFRYAGLTPFNGNALNWITDGLPARLPDFLAGMAAVDLVFGRWRNQTWTGSPLTLAAGLGTCLGVAWTWSAWFVGAAPTIAAVPLTLALDVGILLATAFLFSRPNPINRALDAALSLRPAQLPGMMCYSLYVWHGLLEYRLILSRSTAFAARLDALPLYLFFLSALAWLSYRHIEFGDRPWRTLLPARRRPPEPPSFQAPSFQAPPLQAPPLQANANADAALSAMAKDDVRPGDSIPNR